MLSASKTQWISAVTVATLVLGGTPVAAQTVNFNGVATYSGDCEANDLWGGSPTQIGAHQGMFFAGLFALDVNHYQNECWGAHPELAPPKNGYLNADGVPLAPIVGLLRWPGMVQRANGDLFNLNSMQVGAGWTDVTLTFRGYRGWKADNPSVALFETFEINPLLGLKTLNFAGWTGIRYIEIEASYGNEDLYNIVARSGEPLYKTSFVSSVTTSRYVVPEPASIALVAIGLAGLGVAARRRRGVEQR